MKKALETRLAEQQAILKTARDDAELIRRPHCRDGGEIAEERERAVVIDNTLQQTQLNIINIVRALEKIKIDEYGFCERCGDQISEKRLEILPAAQYCLVCQGMVSDSA